MSEDKVLAIANEVIDVISKYDGYTYDDISTIIRKINLQFQITSKKTNTDICDSRDMYLCEIWSAVFDLSFDINYKREYSTRVLSEINRLIQNGTTDIEAFKAVHEKIHEIAVGIAGCKAADEAQAAVEVWG